MSIALEKVSKKPSKLELLKHRAEYRRNRDDLKHTPCQSQSKVFNENFKDMEVEIYKTIE